MKRYRLTTQSNRHPEPHVSSVILGESEIQEHLDIEADMHRMAGWVVTRGDWTVVCRRGPITRVIGVRESDAMNDELNYEEE